MRPLLGYLPLLCLRRPWQPSCLRGRRGGISALGGFTLIELLVCIAIIGVLAALLSPAFGKMQDRATTTKCASNLEQIGMALFFYAGDNNGSLPPAGIQQPTWEAAIWPYAGYLVAPSWPDNCWQANPGVGRPNIFHCPVTSQNKAKPVPGLTVCLAHYMFGINSGVVGNLSDPTILSKVSQRSKTAMVLETSFGWGGWYYYWQAFGLIPHDGGSNVLFFDGHVEYRKLENIPKEQTDVFWDGTLE